MKIRKLEKKDAPRILEWMKDPQVNQFFRFDGDKATLESVEKYTEQALDSEHNVHMAITDDNDLYLGTVSLKEIDRTCGTAEYAISLRKDSQGTGAATFGTDEILRIAFMDLGLNRVYLNVLSDNLRANGFYQKYGFIYEGEFIDHICIRGAVKSLKWYRLLKSEYIQKMQK